MILLSNADTILVAIPMIGVLFVGVFRLDEIIGRPQKVSLPRKGFSHRDGDGAVVCVEPDGRVDRGFPQREKA